MRQQQLLILMLLSLFLYACKKNDTAINSNNTQNTLTHYGQTFSIANARMFKSMPFKEKIKKEYIYNYTYTDPSGNTTDHHELGYEFGGVKSYMGNFILSLYGDGITYNSQIEGLQGSGMIASFHFVCSDTSKLIPGKYVYSEKDSIGSFKAYIITTYNPTKDEKLIPATITSGEVNVVQNSADNYTVNFSCVTATGGVVKGNYTGVAPQQIPKTVTINNYTDIKVNGLLDSTYIYDRDYYFYWSISPDNVDMAYLSTAKGVAANSDSKNTDAIDIAVSYNSATASVVFVSPLKSVAQLWGNQPGASFPCHTIYSPAPSGFTDADFNNIKDAKDFSFTVSDQVASIPVSGSNLPQYVFFLTGNGDKGIIKVTAISPPYLNNYIYYGFNVSQPVGPAVTMDIKCTASFSNAKIL